MRGQIATARIESGPPGHWPAHRPDSPAGVSHPANNFSFPETARHSGPEIPNLDGPEISHFQHFISCARSRNREDPICDVEQGHWSTSLCHLANISYRDGRKIEFDPEAGSRAGRFF